MNHSYLRNWSSRGEQCPTTSDTIGPYGLKKAEANNLIRQNIKENSDKTCDEILYGRYQMTKQQIKKMEDLAEDYTSTSYFSLEYSINGKTAQECQDAFKAGYQAAMSEVDGLIEAFEKATYRHHLECEQSNCVDSCPVKIRKEALKTWRDKHE